MIRSFILSFILIFGFHYGLKAQQVSVDSLVNNGSVLKENNEYKKADEHFKQAMKLYLQRKDTINWIRTSFLYGSSLVEQGFVREGIEIYKSVEKKKPQNISISLEARKANLLGWAYEMLEMPDSVKYHLSHGLKLSEQIQDSLRIARISNNLSYYFQNEGDYERAFELQKKAIRYFTLVNDQRRLSAVLNRSFLIMMELGLYQQAETYIRQSLAIREEIGNPNLLDVAYHNLAGNLDQQGKRDSAIIYYSKSLELSRMLQNPYDITQTLINIGDLYERSGDYDNALAYYNEALENNYQTDRPVSIANNLTLLAGIAIRNNDLEDAGAFYREALTRLDEVSAPHALTNLYLQFADLEILRENYSEAKKYISNASEVSHDKDFGTLNVKSHNLLGGIYKTEGKLYKSLAEYKKAYELSSGQTPTGKISPAINLSRAYHEIWSDSAFVFADEAFTLIDSIRTNVAGMAFRSGFFRGHAEFYNEVASWYITRKNNAQKAFELIEAAKSRVLMDELAEAQEETYGDIDEEQLIKKQQLSKQIDQLYNKLSAEVNEDQESLKKELRELEFRYLSLENEIRQMAPALKSFNYPSPISVNEAHKIVDKETGILEFAFAGNKLMRFIITENNISAKVIDSVDNENAKYFLTQTIHNLRDDLLNQAPVGKLQIIGSQLHQILISPDLPANISNIIIIPADILSYLPFEIISSDSGYLIEDYNIKYLPSASIYSFIKNPHRSTTQDMFAVAGSGFIESNPLNVSTRSQTALASLPSTLLEVESIAANFSKSKVLKNDILTESAFKAQDLSVFRYLHFATHGIIDEENSTQSGLVLSNTTVNESPYGEDGFLNSKEISGLRLNADLVTLSACNTAMGKFINGEGLLGLQRSFLTAGASSVVVSLWNIYDRSTSVFMSHFYQKMRMHEEEEFGLWNRSLNWFGMYEHPLFDYKAKALRDAKLAMIDHPYYNHPIHWAPFILIGK